MNYVLEIVSEDLNYFEDTLLIWLMFRRASGIWRACLIARKYKTIFFFYSDFPHLILQKILVSLTMKNSRAAMIFFQNDVKWYVFKSIITDT